MGCCCKGTYRKPAAIIVGQYDNGGNLTDILNATAWNDTFEKSCKKCSTERKVFWQFAVNDVILHELGPSVLDAVFPIGTSSTFDKLVVSAADVTNYLQGQGVAIQNGDSIKVKIIAENCNGMKAHSNVIELVAAPSQSICIGWRTLAYGNAHSLGYGCWRTLNL